MRIERIMPWLALAGLCLAGATGCVTREVVVSVPDGTLDTTEPYVYSFESHAN